MRARLVNKVAIVTGAGAGIGKAVAQLLSENGAIVIVTGRSNNVFEVSEALNEAGGLTKGYIMDVTKEDNIEQVMRQVYDAYGHIDILVNNAGVDGVHVPTHELALKDWKMVMDINLTGPFLCSKHALKYMVKNKSGSIIHIASIVALGGTPDNEIAYHASKGGVRAMNKADAIQYAKYNIRVNAIFPAGVDTKLLQKFLGNDKSKTEEEREQVRKYTENLHPLGRIATPKDIANGVLYLASDEANFVTGAELVIDGGITSK